MEEGVGRSGPFRMYSATPLCCASQTEVAEGLLLGEWPSPCRVSGPLCGLEEFLVKTASTRGSEENNH
jgi:hypothetical protein